MEVQTQTTLDPGPWAIAADYLMSAIAALNRSTFSAGKPTSKHGSIAQIHIAGTMSRGGSFWGGTSTEAVRDEIRAAVENPQVSGIVLSINSPGGYVRGTKELADAVKAAAETKPVYAAIQDVGASAAYWVASQATRVFATEDSVVGSIGTMAVVTDSSRAAEDAGYKVHVIRADATSEHKAFGQPGVPISENQLTEVKKQLNAFNDFFVSAVANGRGLNKTQLAQVADGRVFLAGEAKDLGLIDEVASTQQVLSMIEAATSANALRSVAVSNAETTNATADVAQQPSTVETVQTTIAAYKSACPKASDSQIVSWLASGTSVNEAMCSYIASLETEIEELKNKPAQTQVVTAPSADGTGVQPVVIGLQPIVATGQPSTTAETACEQWQAALKVLVDKGTSREAAVMQLQKEQPQLWAEYVKEFNAVKR